MSRGPDSRVQNRDMYWFAHGGIEPSGDKNLLQRNPGDTEEESSDSSWKSLPERKPLTEDSRPLAQPKDSADGAVNSSPLLSLERDDRLRASDKRIAVEERKKQLWEAEQERNDAVLKKHLEREAALEARRNAQRSNISFAFGSSIPRNVDSLQGGDGDRVSRHSPAGGVTPKEESHETCVERRSLSPLNCSGSSFFGEQISVCPPSWLVGSGALIGDDVMSRSVSSAVAPRGRRKNDLMPTVPYERTPAAPKGHTPPSTSRKRSVSMTRLDQLARPRRHYVEATKANSTASGHQKDSVRSPTRPLSSASEQSGGSGKAPARRLRSSPRKPRPMSIAGTVPEQAHKRNTATIKKLAENLKKVVPSAIKIALSKPSEKSKPAKEKPRPAEKTKLTLPADKSKPHPVVTSTPKPAKPAVAKANASGKASSPKAAVGKKSATNKKKDNMLVSTPVGPELENSQAEEPVKPSSSRSSSPTVEVASAENEKNSGKKIISEEEAKAALAEKRKVAREQAEREAELERQRQEELRLVEEEQQRQEEECQRVFEEEQLLLVEEHRKQEEEKLRRAIEEQEKKDQEEKARREEEMRLKAEQEKKAQEEAEKQRIELEEKLRKEEEERAERKKRLEKIMSRTRGKGSGTSPSGSVSSGDQHDQQEGFSSGANSLESNETGDLPSGPSSHEDTKAQTEFLSEGNSLEGNPTLEVSSESGSISSNDLAMPISETASQNSSLVIIPDEGEVSAAVDSFGQAKEVSDQMIEKDALVCEPLVHADSSAESQGAMPTSGDASEEIESSENVLNLADEQGNLPALSLGESQKTDSKSDQAESRNAIQDQLKLLSSADQQLEQLQFSSSNQLDEQLQFSSSDQQGDLLQENSAMDQQDNQSQQFSSGVQENLLQQVSNSYHQGDNLEQIPASYQHDDPLQQIPAFNEQPVSAIFNSSKDLKPVSAIFNSSKELDDREHVAEITPLSNPNDEFESLYTDVTSYQANFAENSSEQVEKLREELKQEFELYGSMISDSNALNDEFLQSPQIFSMDKPSANTFSALELTTTEELSRENLSHFSTSSDMKLPDPIYETSEDGSISSEKHPDFQSYAFQENTFGQHVEEPVPAPDDVFAEAGSMHAASNVESNPFAANAENEVSCMLENPMSAYERQFQVGITEDVDEFALEREKCVSDVLEESQGGFDGYVEHGASPNSVLDQSESAIFQTESNKENMFQPAVSLTATSNPFSTSDSIFNDCIHAEKENMQFGTGSVTDSNQLANHMFAPGGNPFVENMHPSNDLPAQQCSDFNIHQHAFVSTEQISDFESQTFANEPISSKTEFADVTIVKAQGEDGCIGIISSVDHDQILNDFPKPNLLNEQLKSNLEYRSISDSEDSSLDSNLSQVLTAENDTEGLNHVTEMNNVSKSELISKVENTYNGDSISKSNGNHFSSEEVYSNGHRLESPDRFLAHVSVDGADLSPVDPSRNNRFEGSDFPEKNPFLMQEEQKVLLTPDFFN